MLLLLKNPEKCIHSLIGEKKKIIPIKLLLTISVKVSLRVSIEIQIEF
jgi:hypothetical protein